MRYHINMGHMVLEQVLLLCVLFVFYTKSAKLCDRFPRSLAITFNYDEGLLIPAVICALLHRTQGCDRGIPSASPALRASPPPGHFVMKRDRLALLFPPRLFMDPARGGCRTKWQNCCETAKALQQGPVTL